jgi:aryl-alcohol dehydrogenase
MPTDTRTARITTAAVVATQSAPFVLQDLTLAPPRPDEVIVKLEACGMCHADISAQAGSIPFPLPGVLGHEGVGRVVEIGTAVSDVAVGQRVVISYTSCGKCPACLDAKPGYCALWPVLNLVGGGRDDGSSSLTCDTKAIHSHFFGQSSFSTYVATAARAVVPVPDDIPATILAPLGCGVQTGVCAATDVLKPRTGDRVAVFGAGAVGLSSLMGLALTGAAQIIVIDINPQRLSLAKELGATDIIDARNQDVAAEIKRLTNGAGVNGAIETSGNPQALDTAIAALGAAGTCVVVGVPGHGERGSFDVIDLVARGLHIKGTNQGDANPRVVIPRLIDLYRKGRLPIEKLVTTYAFDAINDARAASLEGSAIKPVLTMPAD